MKLTSYVSNKRTKHHLLLNLLTILHVLVLFILNGNQQHKLTKRDPKFKRNGKSQNKEKMSTNAERQTCTSRKQKHKHKARNLATKKRLSHVLISTFPNQQRFASNLNTHCQFFLSHPRYFSSVPCYRLPQFESACNLRDD